MFSDQLAGCVSSFEAALERLAWDLAHQILNQALLGRASDEKPTAQRVRTDRRPPRISDRASTPSTPTKRRQRRVSKVSAAPKVPNKRVPSEATTATTPLQLELQMPAEVSGERIVDAGVAAEPVPMDPTPAAEVATGTGVPSVSPTGRRARWTRESIIEQLCQHLLAGSAEASFLRRHGEPGLVTTAVRIFGRFESALNVANLELARRYPDGPPSKARRGRQTASTVAVR